jgi:hypothetical protein
VCGQHHALAAFTPGKDLVPIVQEARWAPEPVWIGVENLAPPGFDPQTFQPVASHYTDYAILAPCQLDNNTIKYAPVLLTTPVLLNMIAGAFSPQHLLWPTAHTPLMPTPVIYFFKINYLSFVKI